jgi:hypothetical protein
MKVMEQRVRYQLKGERERVKEREREGEREYLFLKE